MSSRVEWFTPAAYGMFIHWGPYSVAARGEWVMNRERIPADEYRRLYAENFRAENYDPAEWAALAKRCGMRYVVLTTRHHDGFALWNTATTDFNAAKLGPGRDLLEPFAQAVRAEGLKLGFYLSAADWTHPDYPGAFARDWPDTDDWQSEDARLRFVAYYRKQVEELLTHYGHVDMLWWDGCIPQPLEGGRVNETAYRLQPHIIINERNGEPFDFRCSEQSLKDKPGPWEACMTLNNNWGYHASDHNWKSASEVVDMLLNVRGNAGNLLINVGPRPDGTIPAESVDILQRAGDWIARNAEFLDTTDRSPFAWNNVSMPTVKGETLYLHLRKDPLGEYCYADLKNEVRAARWLDSGEPVDFTRLDDGRLVFRNLPSPLGDELGRTIAVDCKGTPEPITEQTTFWIPE
ncbi:MAG: alpha-L-fucosidase [Phycisphaerae bacterium]